MLNQAWLTVTVLVLLAGLLTRQGGLLIAGLALVLAEAASWVWGRYALTGVAYDRVLSEGRAFFGEQVTLDVRTENRKLLPLAWLAVEDEFPEPLRLARGRASPSHKPRRALLYNLLTLRSTRWCGRGCWPSSSAAPFCTTCSPCAGTSG